MLQGGNTGIRRKSIKENNFEESVDIRQETHHMVQELAGQLVTNGAGLTEFTGKLVRSASKMPQECLASFGIRGSPGRTDDRVDGGTCSWSEERK